jgi:hypothetical protein
MARQGCFASAVRVLSMASMIVAIVGCGSEAGDPTITETEIDASADASPAVGDASAPDTGRDSGPTGPLVVDAGGPRAACSGAGVAIGPAPAAGFTYQWAPADGLDNPKAARPLASPSETTTYTVTVTQTATGLTGTDSVVVTVLPLPDLTAAADVELSTGGSVVLGTPAVGTETYAWSCNRASCALSSATDAQPVASPLRSTEYTVTVTNAEGCSAATTTKVWTELRGTPIPDGVTLGTDLQPWPANANLAVTFDQDIDPGTLAGNVALFDEIAEVAVPVSVAYEVANRRLVVTPGAGYAENNDYSLTIKGGAAGVLSSDAILPSRLHGDIQVDYTTGAIDTTPPSVIASTPANGATNVAMNTSITVTFSEPIDPTTLDAASFVLSSAGGVIAGALTYEASSRSALFIPTNLLAADTVHTVTLNGIADFAGNAMGTVAISFTTGSTTDTTPPSAILAPTGAGHPVNTVVTVTFDEPVRATTLELGIRVRETISGQLVPGALTYNATTLTATFTPYAPLASETSYTTRVLGVQDLAGNAIAAPGISASFTTAKVLFSDDFESGTAKWTLATPWGLATNTFASRSHSLADSPVGKYASGVDVAATSQSIDITDTTSVTVQWRQRVKTSKNRDWVYMLYSFDGGASWSDLKPRFSGNQGWMLNSVTLPTTGQTTLQIRFRLEDNSDAKQFDGVYVDDVFVQTP